MPEVKSGIYLEIKKGTLGVGHTAKETEYRNFWMTLAQEDENVHCVLLNQDFGLTHINETFPASDFDSGRLNYIPQGEKRYQRLLRELLEAEMKRRSGQKAKEEAQTKPESAKWWEGDQKNIQAGDLFKREAGKREPQSAPPSGNWWEGGGGKELTAEDIFGGPGRGKQTDSASKPKPKAATSQPLKKSWWDK